MARTDWEPPETLGFHAVAKPVVASTAAARLRVTFAPEELRTEVKSPPRYTLAPEIVSAYTRLLRLGSQAVNRPSASMAAARLRVARFTWVKFPPRYTAVSEAANALTVRCEGRLGFHAVAKPVVASTAAALLRVPVDDAPVRTWSNAPPRCTVAPVTASAFTSPRGLGFHAVA